MFWSPAFGVSLLAKNWSAFAANAIIVEREGGADWEDYWSVQPTFDETSASAKVNASIINQPMRVRRETRFLEQGIASEVHLTVDGHVNGHSVWESFPYTLSKPRPLRITLLDDRAQPMEREGRAAAILFHDGGAEGHMIVFDQPRLCRVTTVRSVDHYNGEREHGSVLAEVPGGVQRGSHRVRWMMTATPIAEIGQRMQMGLNLLNQE